MPTATKQYTRCTGETLDCLGIDDLTCRDQFVLCLDGDKSDGFNYGDCMQQARDNSCL